MVQTRSVTAKIQSGQVHDHDGVLPRGSAVDPSLSDEASPPPPKRRRRNKAESPKKRRRGKREQMCQLNLDVLFLIAEYIHPMDLLNLARTCKSLRELLMDKSSEFVWKTARCHVTGLPDCPADLTEPEYANLVFCARCHSCGKPARTVLWRLRRRYCPKCKPEQLCDISYCSEIICGRNVLPTESLFLDDGLSDWVDKGQMELFLDEYHRSTDKEQFLNHKRKQYYAILLHASGCERWQQSKAIERRDNLATRRDERDKSIFEKLKQHGYEPEIRFFGKHDIRGSHKAAFRTSKPLTDKEWDLMLSEWHNILADYRSRRMNAEVYRPRLQLLANEYDTYVTSPMPDEPIFDLLPHVVDLASFGPFRDVIRAPEETEMNDKEPFKSAFAQLPELIKEWRKKLVTELVELVNIPLHLLSEGPSSDKSLCSIGRGATSQMDSHKLDLACALFQVDNGGCYSHLDALSVSMHNYYRSECGLERPGSIQQRFSIRFMAEAPYIVHTCGLDPSVATVGDMDHRNARLKCLYCKCEVMDWRMAMWHAGGYYHRTRVLTPLGDAPRWQLVDTDTQVVSDPARTYRCCLLCRRRVGGALHHATIAGHVVTNHEIAREEVKEGVHYMSLGI